ncbi:unnamed protein product [Peniophora sp. CBMAI 1063]|nr:unnamed protein product [Peniophora sp. CBMAI 1063]
MPDGPSFHTEDLLGSIGYAQAVEAGSSGIDVIIVGCGFAGITCAIESVRKGHSVTVLEKYDELRMIGDVISFGLNVGRFFMRWGLHDRLWPLCGHATELQLYNHLGELLNKQPFQQSAPGTCSYNGHRGEIFAALLDYAREIGVRIRTGCDVVEYWEDNEHDKAGVVLEGGERLVADVVIGADGVHSRARNLILGYDDKPISSGYAIYRTWFNAQDVGIDKDPLTDFLARDEDIFKCWIGQDMHLIVTNCQKGTRVSALLTHVDSTDIGESWSFPGDRADVLKLVEGWDPVCAAVLSKAPHFVDWKLVGREPLPTWVSKHGRLAIIGDAAHPFLPTSVQGASQAVEDGVALAIALQLGGKRDIPNAVRTWEHIRYKRVRYAQVLGETTRNKWHRATAGEHGEKLSLPRPDWLLNFDEERHTYEVFHAVKERLQRDGYSRPTLPEDDRAAPSLE